MCVCVVLVAQGGQQARPRGHAHSHDMDKPYYYILLYTYYYVVIRVRVHSTPGLSFEVSARYIISSCDYRLLLALPVFKPRTQSSKQRRHKMTPTMTRMHGTITTRMRMTSIAIPNALCTSSWV